MEINENKLKDILTEQRTAFERHVDKQIDRQREEYQRFLGVMKEDFDSKVQLIGEQYSDINTKLASHSEMIGALTEDVQDIKATLASHTDILASHTEMIGSLKEDVQIVKSDVQFLKGALKKKVDYEEFEALAQRVALLESKIKK